MAFVRPALVLLFFAFACERIPTTSTATEGARPEIENPHEPSPAPEPIVAPTIATPAIPPVDPVVERANEAARRAEAERAAFEATYPLHGVTYHFLAQVFARPSIESRVVGYMRRGAQFRAKSRVSGSGCDGGFHEVPGGGFVCSGQGYRLATTQQMFEPSSQPSLASALPYAYGYVARNDTPQYWHFPTPDEEAAALAAIRVLAESESRSTSEPTPMAAEAANEEVPLDESSEVPRPNDGTERPDEAVEAPPPPGATPDEGMTSDAETDEEGEDALPDYVRMRMRRGFYVSISEEEREEGRRFYRTVRGGYVPRDGVSPNEPPSTRGVVLGEEWNLPIAFVYRSGAHSLLRDPNTGVLRDQGTIAIHTPLVVEEEFRRGDRDYVLGANDVAVRATTVRIARAAERPAGVPVNERWVHVDLSEQTLVAYEGDRPVFATVVSTGKDEHATPTGLWRIESKHISTTMDDLTNGENDYSIEDVPWTMYFQGNYALHGAFWHSHFGRPRSHGCVNLAPTDARWLFQWTGPTLPQGWHGMFARNDGSFVHITE